MLKVTLICVVLGVIVGVLASFAHIPTIWVGLVTGALCGVIAGYRAGKGKGLFRF